MDRASGGVTGSYRWGFGKAEFDEGRWQLSVEGQAVELERKPLEVLQYRIMELTENGIRDFGGTYEDYLRSQGVV